MPLRVGNLARNFFVVASNKKVCIIGAVIGTELAYVKDNLGRCSKDERRALAKKIGKEPITIERIVDGRTKYPRADVVGKLAIHFRTQEKRRK